MAAPMLRAPLASALQHPAGSTWPSPVVHAPARTPLDVHERVDLLDLLRVDDLAVEADEPADARDMMEPLHLGRLQREPDAAAPVPAHVLSGLLFELGVEPDAVVMDLRHVVVGDEARALSGRVPGRARRDLALLHEQDVGPSLLGEVVEETDAHHAPTDDDDSRVCLHGALQRLDPGGSRSISRFQCTRAPRATPRHDFSCGSRGRASGASAG